MDDVLFIDEILIWFEQGYAKLEGTFELKKEITFSTADCGGWLNNRALSGVSGLSSERQMMSKRAGIKLNYHAIARIKRLRTDHSGLMVNSGVLDRIYRTKWRDFAGNHMIFSHSSSSMVSWILHPLTLFTEYRLSIFRYQAQPVPSNNQYKSFIIHHSY